MGAYIKNSKMPKACFDCWYLAYECEHSWADDEKGYYDCRHEQCPLVEILTPHGRLVDVEKIKNTIGKFIGYLDEDMITRINIAINKEVPTVIEAEE